MPGDHARFDQEYMTYYHTHLAEARPVLAIKSHTNTHTHAYIGFLLLLRQCVMIGDMKRRETAGAAILRKRRQRRWILIVAEVVINLSGEPLPRNSWRRREKT